MTEKFIFISSFIKVYNEHLDIANIAYSVKYKQSNRKMSSLRCYSISVFARLINPVRIGIKFPPFKILLPSCTLFSLSFVKLKLTFGEREYLL